METYSIGLVPGPVTVSPDVLAVYQTNFGSADLEDDFFALYQRCEALLQQILVTNNQVVTQTGEGMLALWGALKSTVRPGDRVLAVANGVFGYGIAEMARQVGANVRVVDFPYDDVPDPERVRREARLFQPALITAVHCETPSGTLTPLADLGEISQEVGALFYVDFVASAGGVEVRVDDWRIDLGLLGSQKVLSLLPDLAMVTVSQRAWAVIERTNYAGYDALLPWRTAVDDRLFPYTHNWHAMAGLEIAARRLLDEGLPSVFERHASVAAYCRERLQSMGVELFPAREAICSPTVTAAKIPAGWTWPALDQALRARGLVVGGSYGPLFGKVFRIGHMGTQADRELVEQGMDVLAEVLKSV
jgi:aspartate aminotransferase-like enzyme